MFSKQPMTRKLAAFSNGAFIIFFLILVPFITCAQRPVGTDVYSGQGDLNWTPVKNAGVVFAWCKATEGTGYVNPYFSEQMAGASGVGIVVGAYHYATPSADPNITGANSADSEAAHFWANAGSYIKAGGGNLVPMLDWEDPLCTNAAGFTISFMSQWLNEWCNDISNDAAAQGIIIRPVVYTGTWYSVPTSGNSGYPGLNTTVTNWPNWMSGYSGNGQSGGPSFAPWPGWYIWQYADTNWSGGDSDVYTGNFQGFLQTFEIGGTNAPDFVTSPANLTVNLGTNLTLSSKVSGQSPVFRWYLDGNLISSATSSNYTIASVQLANAGYYTVTASNSYAVVSAQSILSVLGYLTNSPGAALDPSNMVNWWTGNGNSYDIYGVTNLTPFGNLSYTNAKVGMGFRFDGSTTYLSNNAPEIAPPWTVCAWIYRQNTPQSGASLMGDQTYAIKIQQYGKTTDLGVSHSGVCDFYIPAGLTVNAWSHLAITYTGTQIQFYVNGASVGSQLYSNNVAVPTPPGFELPRAYIGADWFTTVAGDYDDFMLGAVNELQIYNRALSASEIQTIYNAGSAGLVRAPQFTSMTNLNIGQLQLNLIGQTGKAITLLSSTNLLSNWSTLGAVSNPTGATNYTDSTAASPQKFYQATQKY